VIHDDRCATWKGHPCNCAAAAFDRELNPPAGPPSAAEVAQAEKELRQIRREYAQQEKQR
jgi:hypothetical protein